MAAVVGVASLAGIALWLYITSDKNPDAGSNRRGRRRTGTRSRIRNTDGVENVEEPEKADHLDDKSVDISQKLGSEDARVNRIVNNARPPTPGHQTVESPSSSRNHRPETPPKATDSVATSTSDINDAKLISVSTTAPAPLSPALLAAVGADLPSTGASDSSTTRPATVEQEAVLVDDGSPVLVDDGSPVFSTTPATTEADMSSDAASNSPTPQQAAKKEQQNSTVIDDGLPAPEEPNNDPTSLQDVLKWERLCNNAGHMEIQIFVHADIVGRFIGRNGRSIKQLQAAGARVSFTDGANQDRSQGRLCNISGELEAVRLVLKTVAERFPSAAAYQILTRNRPSNMKIYRCVPCPHPGFVEWPEVQQVDVNIVNINTPDCFHVQLPKGGSVRQLNDMHTVMTAFYQQAKDFVKEGVAEFTPGSYCACHVKEDWIRGRVVSAEETDAVNVELLDFGPIVSIPLSHLHPLRLVFIKFVEFTITMESWLPYSKPSRKLHWHFLDIWYQFLIIILLRLHVPYLRDLCPLLNSTLSAWYIAEIQVSLDLCLVIVPYFFCCFHCTFQCR